MGWLTKILKGSSHKFSDGQCNGRYREDRNLEGPRYSAVSELYCFLVHFELKIKGFLEFLIQEGSDFDKEEIECAIALSLSEQEHVIPQDDKGKKIIEYKSETEEDDDDDEDEDEEYMRAQLEAAEEEERRVAQAQIEEEEKRRAEAQLEETEKLLAKARLEEEEMRRSKAQLEEDELLAKALQESMNVGSPPRYDPGNILQPYPFLIPSSHRICVGCQAEIGHGRFLSCMGGVWHPECFCCNACDKPIIDYEVPIHFIKYYYCILLILLKLNLFKLCFTVLNVRKSALSQIMLQGAASS
jgi:hypothetical protein